MCNLTHKIVLAWVYSSKVLNAEVFVRDISAFTYEKDLKTSSTTGLSWYQAVSCLIVT